MAVLETGALEQLSQILDGDRAELGTLVSDFLRNARSHVANMESSVATRNVQELERSAHSLKSNAALFGATGLSNVCARIEQQVIERDLGAIMPLIAEAKTECARAQAALLQVVPEAVPPP